MTSEIPELLTSLKYSVRTLVESFTFASCFSEAGDNWVNTLQEWDFELPSLESGKKMKCVRMTNFDKLETFFLIHQLKPMINWGKETFFKKTNKKI